MKICISLSGGGSNGIIQVGYLKFFYEKGVEFEVIAGTSTGSLQGAMYAQGDFPKLLKIWTDIRNHKDIYCHHFPLSFIQGIFKKSLYSARPLREKIEKYVDIEKLTQSKQRFVSCSTDISNMKAFYMESLPAFAGDIRKFIYASSAFPLAFEPVVHDDRVFWDGGLVEPIPVEIAVRLCPDADLYLIGLTNPIYQQPDRNIGKTIFGYGLRAIESMFQEIWENDIRKGMRYWMDDRFKIMSPETSPFPSSLEWYPDRYEEKIAEGYEIARRATDGLI